MATLCCVDYGFECDFAADSNDDTELIAEFAKHTLNEHGIEYSKEALMQFMLRKQNTTNFEDPYLQVV